MTDSFVTQCPHCRTSFRVNSSQLGAAQGAVRCGACLHVFNAHQHLLDKPKGHTSETPAAPAPAPGSVATASVPAVPGAPSAAAENAATARKDPLDTVWIHDDLDLDSLDLDEELARLEQQEQLHARALMPLEPRATQTRPARTDTTTEPAADERWAERLLEESQQTNSTQLAEPDLGPTPTPVKQPAAPDDSSQSLDKAEPAGEDLEGATEEHVPESEPHALEQQFEEIELTEKNPEPHTAAVLQRNEGLFELNQDPLHLEWRAPGKPWGRWLGWGALNLLAAAALASQYALYHFAELARQDKYRPWFETVCPQLGCTLPSKVDINLIKSSNLVVRSHPDFAGALVVDAILYNRASFSQPFPLLELRFSDMNNRLLANRSFKPSEYLAGELSGQSEMPPQTPIHISLDILDPGQEAVNYSLTFQSPE